MVDGPQSIVSSWALVKWVLIAAVWMLLANACNRNDKHSDHADSYTCPMHPTVVSDKPGTCPVCGMELVRKARSGEEVKITEDIARLTRSTNEVVMSAVSTTKGEFKAMPVEVKGQGIVTYDTRNMYTIPARIGGRLEKVFLKYAFQPVKRGQKVAEIYSPELLTAQRELLYLIENDPANTSIIASAKNRLYLLGASQDQVTDLIQRKRVELTFSIFSPYDGFVVMEDALVPTIKKSSSTSSMSGGGMARGGESASASGNAAPMTVSTSELLREGNYVSAGQTLFKVVNTSALRVELDLPGAQSGRLILNDEVDLDLGNNNIVAGKVDFIQPFFSDGEDFVKVRLYVKNTVELQIGQLVNARIRLKPVEALWVPRDAVVDLGLEKIVFIKERDVFQPKHVNVGIQTEGWVEIKQGLSSSDEIAAHAQYLMDSESFIKVTR